MAQFTRLTFGEVARLASRIDAGELVSFRGLEEGTINSNFRVDTTRGAWFLRVNEGKREADVRYEVDLVDHLVACGVPTPVARFDRDGERLLTWFEWVPGAHRASGGVGEGDARQLGGALAQLHEAARGFPARESIYTTPRIAQRLAPLAPLPATAELQREAAWLGERAAGRAALPGGVIHGDLFPDNVLYDADRLSALLDFEQAAAGTFLYDLAVCALSWCWDGAALDLVLVRALAAGYQERRPLTPAERAGFLTEARAAAFRFTVTRLTDVEYNPAVPPERRAAKDYRRFLARLAWLHAHGDALSACF